MAEWNQKLLFHVRDCENNPTGGGWAVAVGICVIMAVYVFKLVVTLIDAGVIWVLPKVSVISACSACWRIHRRYFAVACMLFLNNAQERTTRIHACSTCGAADEILVSSVCMVLFVTFFSQLVISHLFKNGIFLCASAAAANGVLLYTVQANAGRGSGLERFSQKTLGSGCGGGASCIWKGAQETGSGRQQT